MILTPDQIVIKDWKNLEVYIHDDFGISYEDQVKIPMKSGNEYVLNIKKIKPVPEWVGNDKPTKENGWFLVTLEKGGEN